jgi:hypothetical protein
MGAWNSKEFEYSIMFCGNWVNSNETDLQLISLEKHFAVFLLYLET